MKFFGSLIIYFSILIGILIADDNSTQGYQDTLKLEKLQVKGVKERLEQTGKLANTIQKTEIIGLVTIEKKQANTLVEIIENESGIRVNNECSMCGIKRVMINGLKGEHTTILVDGVPMHSIVSSYYGMDAIGSAGLESVEIARGAGAALASPEAIGGTINLVTKKALKNSLKFDFSRGNDNYNNFSVLATEVSKDKKLRITVAGQFNSKNGYDADGNGVSESPEMNNQSLMVKLQHDFTPNDTLEIRFAEYASEVIGGPYNKNKYEIFKSESLGSVNNNQLFKSGDIREEYLGNSWQTAEIIETKRDELLTRYTHQVNDDLNYLFALAYVGHEQESYYEGFDYSNSNQIYYGNLKFNYTLSDYHLLSFGIDLRQEDMDSYSLKLKELQILDPTLNGDSYEYTSTGAYVVDVWDAASNIEVSFALRVNNLKVNWLEQTEQDNEIDKTIAVPRLHIRWDHNAEFTSRLSTGQGYRAPLSFFETDHGILEDGFDIAVDEIETSNAVGYSLKYQNTNLKIITSLARTEVDHLAYLDNSGSRPTLRNSEETVGVSTYDVVAAFNLSPELVIFTSYEVFLYDDNYKQTFSVAPIEERTRLGFDYETPHVVYNFTLNWIGARDLTEYGYDNRYNIWNDNDNDGVVDEGELVDEKDINAPAYYTIDVKMTSKINNKMKFYLGVKNLLDYSQAKNGESPLFWKGKEGEEASYDVGYIYAPLRGRLAYAGIKYTF